MLVRTIMWRSHWPLLFSLMSASCTPILPWHFAESPETLKAREVSLTVAGGGGAGGGNGGNLNSCCGGGAARLRVGVGHEQEVGVEGNLIFASSGSVGALKLAYKIAPSPNFAIVAGAGATIDEGRQVALGGDAAGVVATDALGRAGARVYSGLRVSFALPAGGREIYDSGGASEALLVPVGVQLGPARARWRLYLEAGYMAAWSQAREQQEVVGHNWHGGYGALAFSYLWKR
jgi:hypothetical protein